MDLQSIKWGLTHLHYIQVPTSTCDSINIKLLKVLTYPELKSNVFMIKMFRYICVSIYIILEKVKIIIPSQHLSPPHIII